MVKRIELITVDLDEASITITRSGLCDGEYRNLTKRQLQRFGEALTNKINKQYVTDKPLVQYHWWGYGVEW